MLTFSPKFYVIHAEFMQNSAKQWYTLFNILRLWVHLGCVILRPRFPHVATDRKAHILRISLSHEITLGKRNQRFQNLSYLEYTPLSMIAEIGGFVGLFLGLAVVDVRLLIGR